MLAVERKARRVERAVMAAREREAEARRVEAERLCARHGADEDRLRTRLAAVEREAAALRAVGGDDGQFARSRPYYWQR